MFSENSQWGGQGRIQETLQMPENAQIKLTLERIVSDGSGDLSASYLSRFSPFSFTGFRS